ncbi:MAG TPA: phosphoribosylanthranilate isomerase [Oxalicibacterium sp.]|uniref:phosphoribosylanthranilate isomerase n=1 Tax=Oxalicibacterium sp. TaxID=2766525 RepID=UPI002BD347D3|nr:phosphoribosylanthranilate isomerase [Oxalicibacterium sp.]HWU97673.1 phosphoribosylanthranilate isomerase [Oxalicibacterium sp.]
MDIAPGCAAEFPVVVTVYEVSRRTSVMTNRTRIKICGLTREQDVQGAIAAGADAIGFVFYPASPRYVQPAAAAKLVAVVPPFVTTVGLFVNASLEEVQTVLALAPVALLQFHGDETPAQCASIAAAVNRPFVRAVRVKPETAATDLLECESEYRAASALFSGLLLDTFVDSYGGSGKVFDWSLIPENLAPRLVLSGGLNAQNATDAVQRIRPHAVDVSSGVEQAKGIKDSAKIRAFIAAVRAADAVRPD